MDNLLVELKKRGIQLKLDGDRLVVNARKNAVTEELRVALALHKEHLIELLQRSNTAQSMPVIIPNITDKYQPFPLTDLQHAYWLGRDSAMEMGSIATHLYVEFDCQGLDVVRLNDALCQLIERHDMLRAVVDDDGMQRILPTVPRYQIAVDDQSMTSTEVVEQAIIQMREMLSHQVLMADQWPLFDIRATLLPADRLRLYVSLDLLLFDAISLFLFFQEWHQLYEDLHSPLPALKISFRDYVLAERQLEDSEAYQKAHAYWMARVKSLPEAPDLPLRSDPFARKAPRFSRQETRLDKASWKKLQTVARSKGLTPSSLLMAAYSEILARWSATPHFTLNVTLSNRLPLHEDVNRLIGGFTSLVMQEVDHRDRQFTFLEFARHLQEQFFASLEHHQVNGMKVLQQWDKRHGISLGASMPVVFNSALLQTGDREIGEIERFGSKVYSISQTSQVWLEHRVMEVNKELVLIWDAAQAVFEDGVLHAMFAGYRDLIERLVSDDSLWTRRNIVSLPEEMRQLREAVNQTAAEVPEQLLHAGFVNHALQNPQAVAILSNERVMTYGELLSESVAVADWLIQSGVRTGQPVGILMCKGWEQIVAVFGVLLAKAAYMPVDADLPVKRQLELLRIGEVSQVLTQQDLARDEIRAGNWSIHDILPDGQGTYGPVHAESLNRSVDELAYVIFTSGTTGTPKGVMIDHRGAMNTVDHINRLFDIGSQDRVLAVSSLSFDLSVYDIFGLFNAGGALVLPDYRTEHDPVHWRDLIVRHHVTVWNSAPQLMRMLTDSFQPNELEAAPIRKVFLSGDFIPLDLPDGVRKRYPQAEVISLGGATEASIWSNYYRINTINPAWSSIPYGKALPNQTLWVYDHALRPCPDHVKGRIYVGGIGLAMGYWRDPEKTATRFITHPKTGERLYDTGDLGRYDPDGNVIILGRDDGQIKIGGHRVELGEIESVLRQYPQIKQAVVMPTPGAAENWKLVAYVELIEDGVALSSETGFDSQVIKAYLQDRLPYYMVPGYIFLIDRIPISSNGKIDYRALPVLLEGILDNNSDQVLPRNDIEQTMFDIWSRVITNTEIGVTDNFFDLGGDSVLAIRLVRELNAALPFSLRIHEFFENLTIELLAVLYQRRAEDNEYSAVDKKEVADSSPNRRRARDAVLNGRDAILADIRVVADRFNGMDFSADRNLSSSKQEAVLLTGGTGWVGSHILSELLSATGNKVYCLIRARNKADGHKRLIDTMRQRGIEVDPLWLNRIEPVCGDLSAPQFGLDATDWQSLAEKVNAVYHIGASVNVLNEYSTNRSVNVSSLAYIVELAAAHHVKPVFFASSMAVCRRYTNGRLVMLSTEGPNAGPEGLLSGYAQAKWAAEQILLAAAEKGLPVKIYRTSSALPSTRNGIAKSSSVYVNVLKIACEAEVIPDWADSGLDGVPVDILSRLIVETSLAPGEPHTVIHIENRNPQSLKSIIEIMLDEKHQGQSNAPCISVDGWKARCLDIAAHLPGQNESLTRVLFGNRLSGATVENMFSVDHVDTHYFKARGEIAKLSDLTPADYWRMVYRHMVRENK
ncbi:MAG: amino acid adenylation domain-containing protein [Pseudomonadota bacterium]